MPLLVLLLLLTLSAAAAAQETIAPVPDADNLRVARGEARLPLLVPRDEELSFEVVIDVGLLGDIRVGGVVLSSGVDVRLAGLPSAESHDRHVERREEAWIRSHAQGGYMGYQLEHDLKTRLLPQDWPALFHTDTQKGSENRRRELKLGLQAGQRVAEYRADGHCTGCTSREHFVEGLFWWSSAYHCKKCKRGEHRAWKPPVQREIPPGTLDMLGAVYLARSLVRDGRVEEVFPLCDKQRLWEVTLRRGPQRRIKVPAGSFDCVQVQLATGLLAGEPDEEEGGTHFRGLFGIQGSIRIWMEARTGVPVLIEGDLPVPVIGMLEVSVQLKRFRGTPAAFRSLR